jgi:YVTN family beta-propeller protein
LILAVTTLSCAVAAEYSAPAGTRPAHAKPENTVLPGGRLLSPFGSHFITGSGTFGIAANDDGSIVASADGGPSGFSITVIRNGAAERIRTKRRGEPAEDEDDWRSVFMGLAFDGSGKLWSSDGNSGRIRLGTGKGSSINLNVNGFKDSYTGDLVLDRQRNRLYVTDQANFRVVTIDTVRRRVMASTKVGRLPFALAMSPDASRLYVTHIGMFEYKTLEGDPIPFPAFGFPSKESAKALGSPNVREANSLAVLDITGAEPKVVTMIPTGQPFGGKIMGGSSPSGVAATADRIYVSNGHNDSISVINARTLKRERDIPIRIPGLEPYRGILPIGLAVIGSKLLVAEAGINAVGVIENGKVIGHIPAAWFPTRIAVHGNTVWVANAKGFGTGPNKGLAQSFQYDLRKGAVTRFEMPSDLTPHTQRVFANNGFVSSATSPARIPDALRNVVLIVKENRTYDEVFGEGGRFGPKVAPNHAELARRFASSSNFYADSEVSVDGHHWIVGSYPDAWTESSLMASYGGQKDFRAGTTAPGRLIFAQSNSSVHPDEQLEAGSLWHHLDRNGITFRNFGEGFELAGVDEGEGLKPTGARYKTNVPMPDPLFRNTSRTYPQYNTNIPDQFRADQLLKELKEISQLPRLLFIHLPNDHGAAPRPKDGYPVAASFMADNDYALGRIMTYLTSRPEWKQTAVFITEDDAQGGVDPVDSHRTVMLVASPYAKPGYVSQKHSSMPGLLKTVFRILRIPPLNLYDATAADLSDCFTTEADLRPYEIKPVDPAIFDPSKAREPRDPLPPTAMDDPRELRRQHKR